MGKAAPSLSHWYLSSTPSPSTALVGKTLSVTELGGICSFCILGLGSCCKINGYGECVFVVTLFLLLPRHEEAGVHVP